MGVSFDSYKTFYYVAKFRSFTEAAKALYVTQPTVTHAIQMLEKELDCILFQRSRKGVSLTPEAAMLYEHVKAACEHIFEAENALKAKKELLEGRYGSEQGKPRCIFFCFPI
ncbi:MAG: LysR family transcriptional regulator [Eisenbergiella sp.]